MKDAPAHSVATPKDDFLKKKNDIIVGIKLVKIPKKKKRQHKYYKKLQGQLRHLKNWHCSSGVISN
jgi:hypothetical protein